MIPLHEITLCNYDPASFDRMMLPIAGGCGVVGIPPEQKAEMARRAGVHADMLHYHSPARTVEIKPFWIDRHPVTRGQFLRFMRETGYSVEYNGYLVGWSEMTGWHDFSPETAALPMVGVSADDAQAYAAWVGKRLPSESEWEWVWRGAAGTLFPWGDVWEDGHCFRSPGNISLSQTIPVGAYGPAGPFGVEDFGLVMEWVAVEQPAFSKSGKKDHNPFVLAGGSFLHQQPYSFLPTNRSSWSSGKRIYNAGFRCVSDVPPPDLIADPSYRVESWAEPTPLVMQPDLLNTSAIRLNPYGCASLAIEAPWFPQSLWILDCPEGDWDGFGGANAWPARPEEEWRIPWKVNADHSVARYERVNGGKRLIFEARVDGQTVNYSYTIEGMVPVRASTFCFKTFSPFFSSQERLTQVIIDEGGVTPCCNLPVDENTAVSLGWSLGVISPPARAALRSFDGRGWVQYNGTKAQVFGNGWVPCTHLHLTDNNGMIQQQGNGSFSFYIED